MTSTKNSIIVFTSFLSFFVATNVVFGASFTIDTLNLNETHPITTSAYLTPNKLHLKEVWEKLNNDISIPSHPVKIGIIDFRIDAKHLEFAGVAIGASTVGKVNFGHSPILALSPNSFAPFNDSHGAAVTGIIGANNISSGGSTNYIFPQMNGILSGVSRLDYTLELRSPKTQVSFLFNDIGRMDDLINEKVQIINFSRGVDSVKSFPFRSVSRRITNNPDILFVFAAGNDGVDADSITPANLGNLPNVITVGSVNNNDERAIFTSTESSNFGNSVSISAPGIDIDAPRLTSYALFSGTSFSAPLVTGTAGILKSINPALTPAEIKQILVRSADTIPVIDNKPIGGRLNALSAVCDAEVLNCTQGLGIVEGHTVLNECGGPIILPNMRVEAIRESDRQIIAETISDSEGFYRLSLLPGTYFIGELVSVLAGETVQHNVEVSVVC